MRAHLRTKVELDVSKDERHALHGAADIISGEDFWVETELSSEQIDAVVALVEAVGWAE